MTEKLALTIEDLQDPFFSLRKLLIELFNHRLQTCEEANYSIPMTNADIFSFQAFLCRVVNEIGSRAHRHVSRVVSGPIEKETLNLPVDMAQYGKVSDG